MRIRIALVAGLLLALGAFAPTAFAGTHTSKTYVDVFVDCVTQNSGSYDATFGYKNENSTVQTLPVGSDNYFSPPPIDRGQTTSFQPGTVHNAFTVTAIPSATKLTWTVSLNGHTESVSVSSSSSKACTADPAPAIHVSVDCVTKNSDNTYDATFAYANDGPSAQTVPVGSDNYFSPPPIDRSQTTAFAPGTHHAAFTVKGVPNATKLTWTVRTRSTTASSSGHACAPVSTDKPIRVAVDCVTKGSTTYDATFAYANDNAVAETVAVGSDNYFSPPPIDRGQTSTFQPGTHHAAFTVTGIPNSTKLTWTVVFANSKRTATASPSSQSCAPASTAKVIRVAVDCVTKGSTTYDATFAYANDNAVAETVAVGSDNYFSPPPIDRGQTSTFQPGTHHAAFTVTGIPNSTKLTWTLVFGGTKRTATASSSAHSCAPTTKKIHVVVTCVTRNNGNYDATFGYQNDNAAAVSVPVGNDNYFSPPPIDRGQTSTFNPGKVTNAFTVKGIPNGARLTWTVNSGGRSDSATTNGGGSRCAPVTPPARVTICHRVNTKRQWVQITVGARTAAWWLRHGDVLPNSNGNCPPPKRRRGHHSNNKHQSNGVKNGTAIRQEKRH